MQLALSYCLILTTVAALERTREEETRLSKGIEKRTLAILAHSGRFKQSETSGAKLPLDQDESPRPLTFPILSPTGPTRNSALFLAVSFCPFLSPLRRALLLVLERRAGNSCSNGFVAATYDPVALFFLRFRRRLHFLRFYPLRWIFATSCLSRGRLESSFISVASPNDSPYDCNDSAGKTFKWSLA